MAEGSLTSALWQWAGVNRIATHLLAESPPTDTPTTSPPLKFYKEDQRESEKNWREEPQPSPAPSGSQDSQSGRHNSEVCLVGPAKLAAAVAGLPTPADWAPCRAVGPREKEGSYGESPGKSQTQAGEDEKLLL